MSGWCTRCHTLRKGNPEHDGDGLCDPCRRAVEALRSVMQPAEMAQRLAVRVRWLREHQGMTQAELSRVSGINRPNIARLESLRVEQVPTLGILARVAHGLGVPLSMLLCVLDEVPSGS